jgi:hypothetical protein
MSIKPSLFVAVAIFVTSTLPLRAHAAEPVSAVSAEHAIVLTGGVGTAERAEFFATAPGYELFASFAEQGDGAFLSNVDVTLSGGNLTRPIALTTDGPLLLADLPTGHYVLKAHVDGWKDRVHEFDVQRFHHDRIFVTFVPEDASR